MADYQLRRGDARAVRRHLVRVLRLGPRAGQGPARRRVARRRDARGDVVDARRGARHVPAPAPPGHAVRDRGALGRAAARGRRPGAADRRPLAGGWASATSPPRPRSTRSSSWSAGIRNARAEARVEPASWLPVDVAVPDGARAGTSRRCARRSSGSPGPGRSSVVTIGRRCTAAGAAGRWRSSPASSRRLIGAARRRRGGATPAPTGAAREGARRGRGLPRRCPRPARERGVHVEGAAGGRRGRPRPRGGARRPGRAVARASRSLTRGRDDREAATTGGPAKGSARACCDQPLTAPPVMPRTK